MSQITVREGTGSPSRSVVLIRPDAPMQAGSARELSARLARLDGARLGILDNGKANADVLLGVAADELRSRFGLRSVTARRKTYPTYPAPKELLDELAREVDCVVTAIGD
ncbi:MAG TPA: hypothetical protein VMS64_23130 [Candidatus Methylomirabilis sp.]|nr:hypothetical protein [Candidatus Methylomirabilis sp.]